MGTLVELRNTVPKDHGIISNGDIAFVMFLWLNDKNM